MPTGARMTDDELAREAARWESLRAVPADWLPAPEAVPRAGEAFTVATFHQPAPTRWRCGNGHEWTTGPGDFSPTVEFDYRDLKGTFCIRCMMNLMAAHGMAAERVPDADRPVAVPREG